MFVFRRKIYQEISETIVSLAVMVSFVSSMFSPQIVNAQTQEAMTLKDYGLLTTDNDQMTNTILPTASERQPRQTIWILATAYSSTPEQTDSTPCLAAKGHDLCKQYEEQEYYDTIAANFLPINAQIRLPEIFGDKIFVVRDRMNPRYGYGRIDIWMPTKQEAKEFGVKKIQIEIF